MKLTGENRSTLSTTNSTCSELGSNPIVRGERPAFERVSSVYVQMSLLCPIPASRRGFQYWIRALYSYNTKRLLAAEVQQWVNAG
jgi:hypothetical protein